MLLHILCSVMMMVSAIMCAPGQGSKNTMQLERKDKSDNHIDNSNPNRGTLDHIGGGNILRSLDSFMGGQVLKREGRDIKKRLTREVKPNNHSDTSNSNRITLDPIGGGNLLGLLDSSAEGQGNNNILRLAREEKSHNTTDTSNPNRGTLDHIGGGNIVRSLDSLMRAMVFRREGRDTMMSLPREVKLNNHSDTSNSIRATLDSIGEDVIELLDSNTGGQWREEFMMELAIEDPLVGASLLRLILMDSYMRGGEVRRSLERNLMLDPQESREGSKNMMRLARKDKSDSHTDTSNPNRGTLDPIGGGNILRSLDSYMRAQVLRREGRDNLMRLAKEVKPNNHMDTSNSNRITLDSIGGGNLLGLLDSNTGGQGRENMIRLAREEESNHYDTSNSMHGVVDQLGGGNFVKSRDSYSKREKSNNDHDSSNSMHSIVDPLGGGNLVVVDPLGGGNLVVVDPLGGGNLVKSRDSYVKEVKSYNHRNSDRNFLDPLGGGHLLRSLDSYTGRHVLKSFVGGEV